MKENNALDKQLTKENREIMTDIVCYLRASDINTYEQERVRRDIAEILLNAQKHDRTAQEVLGEDFREFCDRILEEVPHMTKREYTLATIRDVSLGAAVLLLIRLIFGMLGLGLRFGIWNEVHVSLGDILSFALIIAVAYFMVQMIAKRSFDSDRIVGKWVFVLAFFTLGTCIALNVVLSEAIFTVPTFVAVLFICLVYAGYRYLDEIVD